MNAVFIHEISPYAEGEDCFCDAPATHKVVEDTEEPRHPFTAYICCEHFGQVMGAIARRRCGGSDG